MHENMHLEVTSQGILLINRLYNKLYFFYKDLSGYKLCLKKFGEEFIIDKADTSENYLILTGYERTKKDDQELRTARYRIYDISKFFECKD